MTFSRLKPLRSLILALVSVAGLSAQSVQPVMQVPECTVYFALAAAGNSAAFDNRQVGCSVWTVVYTNTGFAALSLTFQSAPDNAGVPGAWGAFGGAVLVGVNPNVAVTQARTVLYGYFPWVRVNLGGTAGAGTVRGTLYGYKDRSVLALVVGGGSGGAPVYCPNSAAFNFAAAGTAQIVGLIAGQSIRVCHLSMSMSAPTNITLVRGTGANCAVGTTALSGIYQNVTAMALDFGESPLTVTAANALCITQAGAVTTGGTVTFAQY